MSSAHSALDTPNPAVGSPSILLFATTWWPLSTRLAVRLRNLGASVSALVPRHHMMQAASGLTAIHRLRPLSIPQSIRRAIFVSRPDLIVPTDDTAVWLLHDIAQRFPELTSLIERSLGLREHYGTLSSRRQFLALAQSLGILCPLTSQLQSSARLDAIVAQSQFPVVLKNDGTSGGYGVVIARNADQLRRGYRLLLRHRLPLRKFKRLLINGDVASLYHADSYPPDEITTQSFIPGTPANGLFVAQRGQILAHLAVRVERALSETGASVVVERIHHPGMLAAAEKLAARLELSGFFGLDFILNAETGEPWLLEINPRATQLCHIPLTSLLDPSQNAFATLADAIYFVAAGHAPPQLPQQPIHARFAFFPQALTLASDDSVLASAVLDRPDEEPELVAELLRPAWPQRRPWLRLYNRMLRRINRR